MQTILKSENPIINMFNPRAQALTMFIVMKKENTYKEDEEERKFTLELYDKIIVHLIYIDIIILIIWLLT